MGLGSEKNDRAGEPSFISRMEDRLEGGIASEMDSRVPGNGTAVIRTSRLR